MNNKKNLQWRTAYKKGKIIITKKIYQKVKKEQQVKENLKNNVLLVWYFNLLLITKIQKSFKKKNTNSFSFTPINESKLIEISINWKRKK